MQLLLLLLGLPNGHKIVQGVLGLLYYAHIPNALVIVKVELYDFFQDIADEVIFTL